MSGKAKPCPNEAQHTPHPRGYLAHGEWAEGMARTHRQVRCPGCGLFAIWLPKLGIGIEREGRHGN